jgi:hypothetical protein
MQFDRHTIVLLVRPPDAPELSGQELEALQDAHLANQADLRTQGYLVAAGPLEGQDHERLRGSGGSPAAGNSFPQPIRAAGRPGRAAIGHGSPTPRPQPRPATTSVWLQDRRAGHP